MQLAQPKPVPPRKGRPAALGASPSRLAQRVERGVKARSDSGGASFQIMLPWMTTSDSGYATQGSTQPSAFSSADRPGHSIS